MVTRWRCTRMNVPDMTNLQITGNLSVEITNIIFVGGSLESPYWLASAFCPKILGSWWGPMKAFCHSMNVDGVVILLGGGGDTSTLHVITELVWIFCTQKLWGLKYLVFTCPHALAHLVHLHLHALPLHPFALPSLCPWTISGGCKGTRAGGCKGGRV